MNARNLILATLPWMVACGRVTTPDGEAEESTDQLTAGSGGNQGSDTAQDDSAQDDSGNQDTADHDTAHDDTADGTSHSGDSQDTGAGGQYGYEFRTVEVDDETVRITLDYSEIEEVSVEASAFLISGSSASMGNWFNGTKDAEIGKLDPPRGESTHAYFLAGDDAVAPQTLWAQLDHPLGRPMDFSALQGFGFWARFENADEVVHVLGNAEGRAIQSYEDGDPLPGFKLSVSTEWEFYFLTFAALDVDSTAVTSLDFVVSDQSASGAFWIDDFGFVCDGICP